MRRRRRTADYLKKQAAGEEVEQLVTLTGDSYRDLRKDGGKMRGRKTITAPAGGARDAPAGGRAQTRGHAETQARPAHRGAFRRPGPRRNL